MNPSTQLALMMKAKRVFEGEETFLSFPALSPLAYLPEKLEFGGGSADLQTLSEFSRLVNQIPRGALFDLAGDAYLWDVYSRIFRDAEVAEGPPDPAASAAYERAAAVLYVNGADGRRQESPTYLVYRQHRDLWIAAMEEYKVGKVTAESSEDAAVKAKWRDVDEPASRKKLEDAEARWAGEGFRAQVEEAERAIRVFTQRPSSTRLWDEWRDAFNPDIDMLTDAASQTFAPTAFSPADPFASSWPEFTLSSDEISRLVAEAPAEIKDVLDLESGGPVAEKISFQYRSVGLTRPWLRTELFRARFWRLPSSDSPLSDPATPAKGACPAYVTGVVFARAIAETVKPAGGGGAVNRFEMLGLPALKLRPEVALRMRPAIAGAAAVRPEIRMAVPAVAVAPAAGFRAMAAPRFAAHAVRTELAAPAPRADAAKMLALTRLSGSAFKVRPDIGIFTPPTPAPPPPPVTSTPGREISILAFICKRLPKCPDPDPGLPWTN